MASIPAFLYHPSCVAGKLCTTIEMHNLLQKRGWSDSPAGMSADFPMPGAMSGEMFNDGSDPEIEEVDIQVESSGASVVASRVADGLNAMPGPTLPRATKIDILALKTSVAIAKLAEVKDVALLKGIRERERKNTKSKGGRKTVIDAINAQIADFA